jgi:sortase A
MAVKQIGRIVFIVGLVMCGYAGYDIAQQWSIGEKYDPQMLPKGKVVQQVSEPKEKPKEVQGVVFKKRPSPGDSIGYLIIPKLKVKLPIVEGTDEEQLSKGIGHYATSVLPGEPDLAVLAGHRESALGSLGDLVNGDELIVETSEYMFTYRMTKHWITHKDDRSVIKHLGEPKLDVITCYPFVYTGSAPNRYIVQADLVKVAGIEDK